MKNLAANLQGGPVGEYRLRRPIERIVRVNTREGLVRCRHFFFPEIYFNLFKEEYIRVFFWLR
jgi:hypothetical protein